MDHITAIVDRNHFQNDGPEEDILRLGDVTEKFRAFGWHAIHVDDGHNIEKLINAFAEVTEISGKPQAIVAETKKGKGVSFMEADPAAWHGKGPSPEQLIQALKEIGI